VQIFDFIAPRRSVGSLCPENWLTPFLPWFPSFDETRPSSDCITEDAVLSRFKAAHGLLICGNQYLADRRIAAAIAVLSASRKVSPETLTYGWLVIASNAAAKGDFEAVRTWTRQAVRAFQSLPPSGQQRHLHRLSGDLLALQSCAAVAGGQLEEAVRMLTDALKCHQTDGSSQSQAFDLLLRSRCLAVMGRRDEAVSDLRRAESLLDRSSMDEVSGRLRSTIQSELGGLLLRHARQALVALN
jgi:tetratricopeptide (TPR) repeat protein